MTPRAQSWREEALFIAVTTVETSPLGIMDGAARRMDGLTVIEGPPMQTGPGI